MIGEPVPGYAWRPPGSPFGPTHTAVDIPAPAGTAAVAVADGIVRSVGEDTKLPYNLDLSEWGGGTMVTIDHVMKHAGLLGGQATPVIAQYAHLSAASVARGQYVRAGDRIGLVGSTGNSTGPHLHFGWRVGGVWRDYRAFRGSGEYAGRTVTSGSAPPSGYGSGPGQGPPSDPFGNPISAYPLDPGKTCAPGYKLGTVNAQLHALPGGLWFNRPTNPDGTITACIREDLGPGDAANFASGQGVAAIVEAAGDLARNGLFLAGFLVVAILGVWILLRGSGGGAPAIAIG